MTYNTAKTYQKRLKGLRFDQLLFLETWYTVERKNALEGLKTGNLQISTSCGVLTEGFDEPSISCIIMARPTRFKGLYIQCVGRGLRLHPSKEDCLVLDFADEGHNLETTISFSKAIPEVQEKKNQESQEEKGKRNHQLHITRNCDEEFDLIGTAKFIWVSIGDGEWSLEDDNRNEIIISPKETGYVAQVLWAASGSFQFLSVLSGFVVLQMGERAKQFSQCLGKCK